MTPRRTTLVVLAAIAVLLAACSGKSDKAGGVTEPVVLRIAAHRVDYFATLFTDEIRRLSNGRIRVEFISGGGDNDPPDSFVRYAREVRDGRYDLGVIEAPAWDELGVRSLEPLQAPLLIDNQSLFRAIVASPIATRMLAGLQSQHVVGLSLMPMWLAHPLGYHAPLRTPADFRGERIHGPVSRLNDAVMSALGARSVHLADVGPSVARHAVDGDELSFFAPSHAWITANVTLFADALTLIANEKRYARLSPDQQRILRAAAVRAVQRATRVMGANSDAKLIPRYCAAGHVVVADPAAIAALRRATRAVYSQLQRDPQVAAAIAAIQDLKRRTPPDPKPRIPAGCSGTATVAQAPERDPSFLDGTYRWRITRAGAVRVGGDPRDSSIGVVAGMTLRGGRWAFASGGDSGTFKVAGDRIAFDWPAVGYTNTFTFRRGADGTLYLTPVLPMDVGDRVVWSSSPWTRVGPPVRKLR